MQRFLAARRLGRRFGGRERVQAHREGPEIEGVCKGMHSVSFDSLSDDELHVAVRRLAARSNLALADLLAHLGEVEARGIHRRRACTTLYTYCRYELRMSEDAAFRRAKAARLVHEHPELRDVVARGEIHLTGLLMIAPLLGGERHGEVLARARFRSKREIARLMAELDPKPEVAALVEPIAPAVARLSPGSIAKAFVGQVRELPVGDRPGDWIEPAERDQEIAEGDAGQAPTDALSEPAEQELAEAERALEGAWQAAQSTQSDRPLRFKVQFTASQEYVDLLEEAVDLLGFKKTTTSLPEVQLRALRELVERLRKRKRTKASPSTAAARLTGANSEGTASTAPARIANAADTEETTSTAPARIADAMKETASAPVRIIEAADESVGTAPARMVDAPNSEETQRAITPRHAPRAPECPTHGRYIPAAISRAVWTRDKAQCAYVDERGRRCAEKRGLELHHREPHARGGPPVESNLELRCKAHNTLAAEDDFGRRYMDLMRGGEGAERMPRTQSPAQSSVTAFNKGA